MKSFDEFKGGYDDLGGSSFFDEIIWLDDPDYAVDMSKLDFQIYDLHLNYKGDQQNWKIGYYLVVIFEDVAFEIFKVDKTEIRIIKNFTNNKIDSLSLDLTKEQIANYPRYIKYFENKE